jgi:D-cysteine desulfhydrase
MLAAEAESLRNSGKTPYVIPEGGSNAMGAWGYVRAVEELALDLTTLPGAKDDPTTIIHATGSGGTTAGLILGVKLLGLNARVVGFNVCNDRDYSTAMWEAVMARRVPRSFLLSARWPAPRAFFWIRSTPAKLSMV